MPQQDFFMTSNISKYLEEENEWQAQATELQLKKKHYWICQFSKGRPLDLTQ